MIAEQSAALRSAPENAVVLSTIHSAKGLEWEAVFLVGMEEGVLPHASNDDLEEERRVAYVAVTRAKRLLGLSYVSERFRQRCSPSQFLYELAGKPRLCIWTDQRLDGADERLPLLSDRERQHLHQAPLAAQERPRSADERECMTSNNKDGAIVRHGQPWSPREDDRLRTLYLKGEPIAALASVHQRGRGAIRSRLVKLGLITRNPMLRSG